MKRTESGWVMATASEVNLVVGELGAFVSIRKGYDNDMTTSVGFTIPAELVSGSLAWGGGQTQGMTAVELGAMTTDQICHLGLSYDDKLGMRMFGAIGNAPGTCPNR